MSTVAIACELGGEIDRGVDVASRCTEGHGQA